MKTKKKGVKREMTEVWNEMFPESKKIRRDFNLKGVVMEERGPYFTIERMERDRLKNFEFI